MKNKPIFILATAGVILGFIAAYAGNRKEAPEPPVFNPAPDPYPQGIYATGIIESFQSSGENINLYPEVGSVVRRILVTEGQFVRQGTPLIELDDSMQRATTEQLLAQASAAQAMLNELKAEPRQEVLEVSAAQVTAARANLKTVGDQLGKIRVSYRLAPRSVSKNDFDNAINAVKSARASLQVAIKQYQLTRAGAWIYDIENQQGQYEALLRQYESASALLGKYAIKAPTSGTVISIKAAVGSYLSPQGVYGTYTQGFDPVLVMMAGGSSEAKNELQVRAFVDEILVHRLPDPSRLGGQMFIRGTNIQIPLEFVRVQPYVTPKIELSDQRQERVDVRVLPVLFKFQKNKETKLYPGQLVDVYLGEKPKQQLGGKAGK